MIQASHPIPTALVRGFHDKGGPIELKVLERQLVRRWLRINFIQRDCVSQLGRHHLEPADTLLPVAFELGDALVGTLGVEAPRHRRQERRVLGIAARGCRRCNWIEGLFGRFEVGAIQQVGPEGLETGLGTDGVVRVAAIADEEVLRESRANKQEDKGYWDSHGNHDQAPTARRARELLLLEAMSRGNQVERGCSRRAVYIRYIFPSGLHLPYLFSGIASQPCRLWVC